MVRRLNTPWWQSSNDRKLTNRAFCSALAYIDDELTGVLSEAIRQTAYSRHQLLPSVTCHGCPLYVWVSQGGNMRGTSSDVFAKARVGSDTVKSGRINVLMCNPDSSSAFEVKTHTAPHHQDDVLAVILCILADAVERREPLGAEPAVQRVVRARDKRVVAKWTVDVDEVYDPSQRKFDHHQNDSALSHDSAASLVWRAHGLAICDHWCRKFGFQSADAQCWNLLVSGVHETVSSYIQYANDIDNNTVKYSENWPELDTPVFDGMVRHLIDTYVRHKCTQEEEGAILSEADVSSSTQALFDAMVRVRATEMERITPYSGMTGTPYQDDYGLVGRMRREGDACLPRDTLDCLFTHHVEDVRHMQQARQIIEDAVTASGKTHPEMLILSKGTKDMEKLIVRNDRCRNVQFVGWPQDEGYTIKGIKGVRFPTWWWVPNRMAKAVRYDVVPEPFANHHLCKLIGLTDVIFVHKSGWIAAVRSRKSAERLMLQAIALNKQSTNEDAQHEGSFTE